MEKDDNRLVSQITRSTMALVLAGGRGSRLEQLTEWRAKPAVPFGGKFRIIDFTLSNCVNSGIRRIGICTQYKAQSLIRHVQRGWSFLDGRFDEFVELLPAQQRIAVDWYRGTADAVYQNLDILRRHAPDYVLILAGDHVYKMDYGKMLAEHFWRRARMSIACVEVPVADARSLGVMQVDNSWRITGFQEKPASPASMPGKPGTALGSMGVYVFSASFLYDELIRNAGAQDTRHDFGHDIIPRLIRRADAVYAHNFSDSCVNMVEGVPYWRDVGTVDAYWDANIELTKVVPDLNLYDRGWPIWTHQEQLPPAKFVFDDESRRGQAIDSLVSGGDVISGATVRRSVLFSNVYAQEHASIEDSVVLPDVDIRARVKLKRAIVDRYCVLPPGLEAGLDPAADRKRFHVTPNGITLITPGMLGQEVHHLR
jgi:glucose-1-phosphate adenylyltransferase